MSDQQYSPPDGFGNQAERLLSLAEDIQAESERELSTLTRHALQQYSTIAFIITATAVLAFAAWTLESLQRSLLIWATIPVLGLGLSLTFIFLRSSQQRHRIQRKLQTNQRALFELMQLLDETEDIASAHWSPFERAQFRVRLARLWMLPSTSDHQEMTDLGGNRRLKVDLSAANLRNADLSGAQMPHVDLSGAVLIGANLKNANLQGAVLTAAALSGARLLEVNLEGANLSHADLSGTLLARANLVDADLRNADLEGAVLTDADLRNADLTGACLTNAAVTAKQLAEARSVTNTLMPSKNVKAYGKMITATDVSPSTTEVEVYNFLNLGYERFHAETVRRGNRLPPHGAREVAVVFAGDKRGGVPDESFLDLIDASNPRYTGWPMWIDSRKFPAPDWRPYTHGNGWEAYILSVGGGIRNHLELWRAEPIGRFYYYTALQDDLLEIESAPEPMTALDPVLAILRTAEALAVSMTFARKMDMSLEDTSLHYAFRWSGLNGRELSTWANAEQFVAPGYVCRQHEVTSRITVPLDTPISALGPFVHDATTELFAAFSGYTPNREMVEDLTFRLLNRKLR